MIFFSVRLRNMDIGYVIIGLMSNLKGQYRKTNRVFFKYWAAIDKKRTIFLVLLALLIFKILKLISALSAMSSNQLLNCDRRSK